MENTAHLSPSTGDSMRFLKPLLMGAALIALLLAAVFGGGRLYEWLFPEISETALLAPGCDLHAGPCSATLEDGGELTLSITPRPIPSLAPLQLQVSSTGLEVSAATVDVYGLSMNMGLFRTALQIGEDGLWQGKSGLPVCTTSRMTWRAEVRLTTDRGVIAAPYEFTIIRGEH